MSLNRYSVSFPLQRYEKFLLFPSISVFQIKLYKLLSSYLKLISFFFFFLNYFLYLCTIKQTTITMQQSNHNDPLGRRTLATNGTQESSKSFGRSELAQMYFPQLKPMSAWLRLKDLLSDDPALAPLLATGRRVFIPREVSLIFECLGTP